jgi:hypothetical protein
VQWSFGRNFINDALPLNPLSKGEGAISEQCKKMIKEKNTHKVLHTMAPLSFGEGLGVRLIILLSFLSTNTFSQITKVTGKVVDANTREALPFVNIIFKGTNVGTTTDVEGFYTISTPLKVDSMYLSYIGYTKAAKAVKRGVTQQINIAMSQGVELKAIEVRPGENPAYRILRQIIAHKDKNNRQNLDE